MKRQSHQLRIKPAGGDAEHYDAFIFACPRDRALDLLTDANPEEREILGANPSQEYEALLRNDASILERRGMCGYC